jgi:hypothetical protein
MWFFLPSIAVDRHRHRELRQASESGGDSVFI